MAKERIDKVIASMGRWSRREVKGLIREGLVLLNGQPAASPEEKVEAETAEIIVAGEPLRYRRFTYLMLHKPAGLLSATEDSRQRTVMELLPEDLRRRGLFPVGRLDRDTEGLLLLTNDPPASRAQKPRGQGLPRPAGRPSHQGGRGGLRGGDHAGGRAAVPAGLPSGGGGSAGGIRHFARG